MNELVDGPVTVHLGDSLAVLRQMPAESVHCCITSPPFWGLRDYGTATWEGGEVECDHVERNSRNDVSPMDLARRAAAYKTGTGPGSAVTTQQYRDICAKCGARRIDLQIGLEATPEEWVERLVDVFREVRRVLRRDGTCWVELGDSYAGSWGAQGHKETPATLSRNSISNHPKRASHTGTIRSVGLKPKDLIGSPWLAAFALRADGWYLRDCIIWYRPNPMPESVTDRTTKSHSYLFLLTKSPRYFYDAEAIREAHFGSELPPRSSKKPDGWDTGLGAHGSVHRNGREAGAASEIRGGRNKRSVWTIPTQAYSDAHFATFPEDLVIPCIKAGTSERGVCPQCAAPWARVVDIGYVNAGNGNNNMAHKGGDFAETGSARPYDVRKLKTTTTTGWQPTCRCEAGEAVPASVLDCFAGSGTTLAVARRLGRKSIGIELNPTYLEFIKARVGKSSLPLLDALVAPDSHVQSDLLDAITERSTS